MDVIDFYPQTFNEIPSQDNPAFDPEAEGYLIVREDEGLMKPIVLKLTPGERWLPVAVFWDHDKAVEYCDMVGD